MQQYECYRRACRNVQKEENELQRSNNRHNTRRIIPQQENRLKRNRLLEIVKKEELNGKTRHSNVDATKTWSKEGAPEMEHLPLSH
ncbi:6127_t:CDS:2 [Gigaspora rosea]|nr:6127_t:CDS:2 [Gigaspora rosea]